MGMKMKELFAQKELEKQGVDPLHSEFHALLVQCTKGK